MLNPFFMSHRKIYFTTVTPFVFNIFICSPLLFLNIKTFLFPSNIESRLLQQPHMTHTSKIIKRRKKKKVFNNFSIYNIFTLNGLNNLYRIILDVKAIWEYPLYYVVVNKKKKLIPK